MLGNASASCNHSSNASSQTQLASDCRQRDNPNLYFDNNLYPKSLGCSPRMQLWANRLINNIILSPEKHQLRRGFNDPHRSAMWARKWAFGVTSKMRFPSTLYRVASSENCPRKTNAAAVNRSASHVGSLKQVAFSSRTWSIARFDFNANVIASCNGSEPSLIFPQANAKAGIKCLISAARPFSLGNCSRQLPDTVVNMLITRQLYRQEASTGFAL